MTERYRKDFEEYVRKYVAEECKEGWLNKPCFYNYYVKKRLGK